MHLISSKQFGRKIVSLLWSEFQCDEAGSLNHKEFGRNIPLWIQPNWPGEVGGSGDTACQSSLEISCKQDWYLQEEMGIYKLDDPKQKETAHLRPIKWSCHDADRPRGKPRVLSRQLGHYVWQPHVLNFLGQTQFQIFFHLVRPCIPILPLENVATKSFRH